MIGGVGPLRPVTGATTAKVMFLFAVHLGPFNTPCLTKMMQAFHEGMRPGRFERHGLDT